MTNNQWKGVPLGWRKDIALAWWDDGGVLALAVDLAHTLAALREDWQLLVEALSDHDVDCLLDHGQDCKEVHRVHTSHLLTMKSGLQPCKNEVKAYLKITLKMKMMKILILMSLIPDAWVSWFLFQNVTAPFNVLLLFQLKGPNTQQQCAIGIWSFVYVCSQLHSLLVCQRDGSQYDPYFHHWESNEMITRKAMAIFIKQTLIILSIGFGGRWSR